MNFRKFLALAAPSALLLGFLAASPAVLAASAVVLDRGNGSYGYCSGAEDAFAAMSCAQKKCEGAGGRNCQVVAGCPEGGFGAVARDPSKRKLGGACGKASGAAAQSAAVEQCRAQGGACRIVETFSDGAAPAPQQAKSSATPVAPAVKQVKPAPQPKSAPVQTQPTAQPKPVPEQVKPVAQPAAQPAPAQPTAPTSLAKKIARAAEKDDKAKATLEKETWAAKERALEEADRDRIAALKIPKKGEIQATLLDDQKKMADMLVGVWSSRNCAEKFWRISKAGEFKYKVFVWYEDGYEDNSEFTVDFAAQLMVLSWSTKLPSTANAPALRYVEKVGSIDDSTYIVVENNYRDFNRTWTVKRCTNKKN